MCIQFINNGIRTLSLVSQALIKLGNPKYDTCALVHSIYVSSSVGKLKAKFSKIKTFSPAIQSLFL